MSTNAFAGLAAIGTVVSDYAYAIEDGCVENLDYEPHKRGKNWIATVVPNRAAPGGLERTFWTHGSGRWYKAPSIMVGDVIEMGGDYYTGRGSARRARRYILVVRVEEGYFIGAFIGETAPTSKGVNDVRAKYLTAA
jgi:hypothetical protein